MRIRQVNTFDLGGGAESVVMRLHGEYRSMGHKAELYVKRRRSSASGVWEIPEATGHGPWGRMFLGFARRVGHHRGRMRGANALATGLKTVARPLAALDRWRGFEDFRFPASRHLASWTAQSPDVVHCHNLHGNYFDLGALADLSQNLPVVLTLHDCWPFTGHCAHSFDCERWKTGCGECPDLSIYPPVRRDRTADNWRRKREIFRRSRLHVAAPSKWLMGRVGDTILGEGVVETRVIHNGIDDAFFAASDRAEMRRALDIGAETLVLLFVANSIRENEWKDYRTLREAARRIAGRFPERCVLLIALGEAADDERWENLTVRFVPFVATAAGVARYYRAADVYMHAARAETFSLTIAEAMACGTPVVAAAVAAVPERIDSLEHPVSQGQPTCGPDRATGILVPPGQSEAMAEAVAALLVDPALGAKLAANAAREAGLRYRARLQAETYLTWFEDIIRIRKSASPT